MTELQRKFIEETGASFDGIPINGVHLEYTAWLEARIQALLIHDVAGSLPTFEETFKRQLYDAGDTQDFKRSGYITVNELWLRNFHKIAQGNDH